MVDNKTRNLLLIVVPVICVIMIALSVFVYSRNDQDTRADASSSQQVNIDTMGIPQVASLDPKSVVEGESMSYYLTIVDSDTPQDQIDIQLLEAPYWMSYSEIGRYLYGIPELGSSDTQKVTLLLDDGEHSVTHTFYILVLPANEQSD